MRYLNIIKNQWLVARAWMMTSVIFMITTLFFAIKLGQVSLEVPVRLVPYDFAASNGYVTVSDSGVGDKESYIADIASADVLNYASWTNQTIVNQHSRFVNRMSPSLYAKQGRVLLEKAEDKKKSEESQTFFVTRTEVNKDKTQVRVVGTLSMYQGRERTRRMEMVYTLTYNSKNGLPMITAFKAEATE